MNARDAEPLDDVILMALLRGDRRGKELREQRGWRPHGPLRLRDLVARIVGELERDRWFPRRWEPAEPGNAVHEGGTIERLGPTRYVYRTQRHHPLSPTTLAERYERRFFTAAGAARHYLRWDLNLPGDLGGYRVIK